MTKTIAYVGALAAALLVVSTGTAAAQSADGSSSDGIDSASLSTASDTDPSDTGAGEDAEGPLGSVGEVLPGSVPGSLPGYTSGPVGSVANSVCAIGTVAGMAANLAGIPLPPVGLVCTAVKPIAESVDHLTQGDVEGSVGAIVGGIPVVGDSLGDVVDTGSATESVEGVLGQEQLGSLTESSLAPDNAAPENATPDNAAPGN